jgi:hypothetical protein
MGRFALRQWNSSYYRHSATVFRVIDEGTWPKIGIIVYDELKPQPWKFRPVTGILDECQISKDGRWLLIKEKLQKDDSGAIKDLDDNILINLETNKERVILDQNGAAGHSDNGYNYIVGADNYQDLAVWTLRMFDPNLEPQGKTIFQTNWKEQVLHVSHCNAVPYINGDFSKQWVLGSGQLQDIIRIPLDGSFDAKIVAPKLGSGDDYDFYPKASVDPYGEYCFWTAFINGRFDIFMARI